MRFLENTALDIPAPDSPGAQIALPMTPPPATRVPAGRRKLWQINPHYHCLILGTCFDVHEVREAAARAGFENDVLADYEMHHACVSTAADRRHPLTIELQKRLEAKYSREVRLFSKTSDETARQALWEERRDSGDIGAALWALVSHSAQDSELLKSVYGEVHMLQHGTCARESKLRRRAASYREKLDTVVTEHEDDREHLLAHLRAASEQSNALETELAACRTELAEARELAARAPQKFDQTTAYSASNDPARLDTARAKLKKQVSLIDKLRTQAARHRNERARATENYQAVQVDATRLECLVKRLLSRDRAAMPGNLTSDSEDPVPTLCGRCVLVIGGQAHQCRHFRAMVEASEGEFLHHDGGIEDKPSRVAELVRRADAVLCPTEQVSHDAMRRAKRLCRAEDKPMIFMQRSSLAAFADGLEQLSRVPTQ